jgi:hypothetical protein
VVSQTEASLEFWRTAHHLDLFHYQALSKFWERVMIITKDDCEDFINKVYTMRSLQKQYFKSRSIDTLRQSIVAELTVDKAIQEFIEYKQTSLF